MSQAILTFSYMVPNCLVNGISHLIKFLNKQLTKVKGQTTLTFVFKNDYTLAYVILLNNKME